jgi:hypothetical protein
MDQSMKFIRWSSFPGVIIGVLVSLTLLPPLVGIALGVLIAMMLWGKNSWREYALHGLIVGALIGLVTALFQMPGEIASSGKTDFQFYDSLLLYLIFGLVGGSIVGWVSGAVIGAISNMKK